MIAAGTVLLLALAALGDIAQIRFVVFEIHHIGQGSLTEGKAQCRDLLVLTSLDLLLFKLEILFTYVTKQVTLMKKSSVLSPSLSVSVPCPRKPRQVSTTSVAEIRLFAKNKK